MSRLFTKLECQGFEKELIDLARNCQTDCPDGLRMGGIYDNTIAATLALLRIPAFYGYP
jgi:hypothetical protein